MNQGAFLTPDKEAFFHKNGYLHFPGFAGPDLVASLLKSLSILESDWIKSKTSQINGVPIKYGRDMAGHPFVQRFIFTSHFSPIFHILLQDTRLQALLPLQGPDARIGEHENDGLVVNHYLNTPDSQFRQMGWHTDSIRDLFYGKKISPMLNVGLHLDDFPQSAGGLRVLPGTHHQSIFKLLFRKRYYFNHRPDPNEVGFDIKAGDLTVHDGRIWHRVVRCPHMGEVSRRRVMYFPVISGKYEPKHAESKTPVYHKFLHLVK